ncbi:endonuclease [Sphingomonas spermidinifaciens]|uniref:Endonuclease n=1 Tax=Sphingomonas spermidinifaciens TaxID=1141889 RepID=A0A2A4B406_9SPHN|nr:endonuclease/exonuclease/phosphatase family protein [Sphingomonas spermidinifaciens]PCD03171.1 endonuclease [Sphingomonas spermidinifaciens]
MRRLIALIALLLAVPSLAQSPTPLTVMSFNVRYPAEGDGPDKWDSRAARLTSTWRRIGADIVGTQELFQHQGDAIVAADPRYAWFGRDRRGGHADEHMGVFYRRDRLKLIEQGDFWLSDTPELPGSISWGHPFPRMVTWGRFERLTDGRRFTLVNTHFPYRAEDGAARVKAAARVAAFVAALPEDEPVVVTGDFNDVPGSAAYRTLTATLSDSWTALGRPEAGTFHGFAGMAERRIDWVLSRGFENKRATIDRQKVGGRYPSDHFPVIATLAFKRP